MNIFSIKTAVELIEDFRLAVEANVGFWLGITIKFTPWTNSTDSGISAEIALGLVNFKVSLHANK